MDIATFEEEIIKLEKANQGLKDSIKKYKEELCHYRKIVENLCYYRMGLLEKVTNIDRLYARGKYNNYSDYLKARETALKQYHDIDNILEEK